MIFIAKVELQGFEKGDEAKLVRFAYEGMETAVIQKAIYDACAHNCPRIGYVLSILNRYKHQGIFTLAAANEDDRRHREANSTALSDAEKRDPGCPQRDHAAQSYGSDLFYDLDGEYPEEGANEA